MKDKLILIHEAEQATTTIELKCYELLLTEALTHVQSILHAAGFGYIEYLTAVSTGGTVYISNQAEYYNGVVK
jgi:hypothetical protein